MHESKKGMITSHVLYFDSYTFPVTWIFYFFFLKWNLVQKFSQRSWDECSGSKPNQSVCAFWLDHIISPVWLQLHMHVFPSPRSCYWRRFSFFNFPTALWRHRPRHMTSSAPVCPAHVLWCHRQKQSNAAAIFRTAPHTFLNVIKYLWKQVNHISAKRVVESEWFVSVSTNWTEFSATLPDVFPSCPLPIRMVQLNP